jgi:hypothetical protein
MSQDITGFGVVVTLVATTTFPVGFPITQFADDADPLDFASVKIGDVAMGLNGDLITWAKAVPLPMVLNVIPGSEDDLNLGILADANRVAQGKISAFDQVSATVAYPDGSVITLTGGKITDAPFGKSIAGSGRLKTKTYAFSFESKNGA